MSELAGIQILDDPSNAGYKEAKEALDYFNVVSNDSHNKIDFKGINKYGIVEIVAMTGEKEKDSDIPDLNAVMESLCNILISAVLKHAGSSDKERVNPEQWRKGFSALCRIVAHNYSDKTTKYEEKIAGKDVVNKVIEIGFDVKGEPSHQLKNAITAYLANQADLMAQMGFESSLNNTYLLFGFSNFNAPTTSSRVCCFRAYFTKFSASSVNVINACRNDDLLYDFDFEVIALNADFMLNSWEHNEDFRKKVMEFIKKHEPIGDPYFDSYFDTWDTAVRLKVN